MNRSYPVLNPTRALNTGSNLTTHLLTNYSIPAKAWHQLWFDTKKQELQHPSDNVFRGNPADSYIVSLLSDLVGLLLRIYL